MLGTLSERNGMRIAPVWVTFLSFFSLSLSLSLKKNLGVCEANSKARKKKEENKSTFEF